MITFIRKSLEEIGRNQRVGMWAWVMQRITGVLLALYLILHVIVISTSQQGTATFDWLASSLQSPGWLLLDVALLIGVVFHGLNGIRIIAVDFGAMARAQKAWLYAMAAVGLVLVAAGIWGILPKIVGHAL